MVELKHTVFMHGLRDLIGENLRDEYQHYKIGESKWIFQVYFGKERRIHYEVSRLTANVGRMLEIGLHFESRDKNLNRLLLDGFSRYLFQLRDDLNSDINAEMWDRGWTKVYETYPSEVLTEKEQQFAAMRLATLIHTLQPVYEHLRRKEIVG